MVNGRRFSFGNDVGECCLPGKLSTVRCVVLSAGKGLLFVAFCLESEKR